MAFPSFEVLNTAKPADLAQTITSADDAFSLTVTDTSTASSGYHRGIACIWTATGDKTSTAEINGIASDITLTSANVPYCYNFTAYQVASGNPTIGYASGVSIYFDDMGSACSAVVGVDIMLGLTTSALDRYTYIRCRKMAASTPTSVLLMEAEVATYLMKLTSSATFLTVSATALSGVTTSHKIACQIGSTTVYIPVVTSGMS